MSQSFFHDTAAPAEHADRLAPLHFAYDGRSASAVLAEPNVLAVLGFGGNAASMDDPRWLRVGLEPLDTPVLEVWRSRRPVRHGRAGNVRWSHDGDYCWFALELDEAVHGGIAAAAEQAYRELGEFIAAGTTPHVLRVWNYLDAINLGEGDDERYRQFCAGRGRGLADRRHDSYPAATAIGRRDGVRVLQVYGLAARQPGAALENPRQLSAWRYPREYGATPPAFARAMRAPDGQLLISGTAAVVGHASTHRNDLVAQLEETAANLASLLRAAGSTRAPGSTSLLKVYVRHPADAPQVITHLRALLPDLGGVLLLAGDICRAELLVEIDGVHGERSSVE